MDNILKLLIGACVAMMVVIVGFIGYHVWQACAHPCIKTERRWREAYTVMVPMVVGKVTVLMPQYHPAGYEDACVARR